MLELRVVEVVIESAFLDELLVRAFFDDVALVHNEDYVCVLDGGEAVRNDKRCLVLHKFFKRLLDFEFGAGVDGTRGLVEYEHRRMREHDSCDAQKLLLSLRYVAAVVVENRVIAVFKVGDEVVNVRRLCRFDDFFVRCVGLSVGYVLSYRAFFEPRVLKHHAVTQTERLSRHFGDVFSLDFDFAAVGVVEAHKKVDEGGLAATRRSDDCDSLSALYAQREALNKRFVFDVGEVNIVDGNVAFGVRKIFESSVGGLILRFEKVEYAARRRRRAL